MRHFSLTFLAAIVVVFGFASTAKAVANPPSVPFALPATFGGVTICGDCPGIKVTITLATDGTYQQKSEYLERSTTNSETGKWSYDESKSLLTLHPDSTNASPQLFSLNLNPSLVMLDAQGKPIPSGPTNVLAQLVEWPAPLEGTLWHLVALDGTAPNPAIDRDGATLQFDATNHRVIGSGGCNRLTASYSRSLLHALHIGAVGMTQMMCPPAAMQTDNGFSQALANVNSFSIDGDTLSLFDKDGKLLARLKAKV